MRQKFLLLAAFLIGFVGVAMEITASRLLAPHYGTSIFIWSNIISVVLLCLAVGYYFGGRLADCRPDFKVLADLCLGGGLLFFLVPKLTPYLVAWGNRFIYDAHPSNAGFFVSSFVVSLFLFGLPLILLGMTSPLLVKIYNLSDHRVGQATGLVYAVSTAGSILGSVAPTFWGLPILGTAKTIIVLAVILLCLTVFDLTRRRAVILGLGLVAVFLIYLIPSKTGSVPAMKLLYEGESYYHHIRVLEDDKARYLVFNEGLSVESVYDKNSLLTGAFYDYYSLLPYQIGNRKPKVLVLGLAGATIPRQYNEFFPEAEVDAVEIDPKVIGVARDYFDLNQVRLNDLIEGDGRGYLAKTDKTYDIIIIDVFQNELYIPWTFTTGEFWRIVSNRLTDGGVVAMNVHSISPDAELLPDMSNTVAKAFPHAYLTSLSGNHRGYSYMLSASRREIGADFAMGDSRLSNLADVFRKNFRQVGFDPDKPVLEDDWAPVDSMLDHSVEYYRKQRIN
ncbi:MAG: spermidine synthase [Candidatus Saccharibacteria bacterium]